MASAAKVFEFVARSVVSVSNKLSIAAVLGLGTASFLTYGAASRANTSGAPPAAAPIEIVRARPVPIAEDILSEPVLQLAARRARAKRESVEEDKTPPDTSRKTSAISPPEPERPSAPVVSEPKPSEAAQAEPAKPDVWTDAQVISALRECVRLLAPIAAEVEVSEPLKQDQCGAPAPVAVRRVGSGAGKVEINPPAVLNCAMVASLHSWVEKTLQPAAQETLGTPIARLRNASGYNCRTRVGSHFNADRLSEHATANAIDIAGFVTSDGRTIEVAHHWGPTIREQREAERLAAARSKDAPSAAEKDGKDGEQKRYKPSDRKISAIAHAAPATKNTRSATRKTAELERPGRATSDVSADPKAIPVAATSGREDAGKGVESQFLRRLHKGACGVFGTVLGPEANEAHRDHFHFDLAQRRRSAYCQ
jgi:hypothetical protein